uniref:Uncharacterized protein n=1 Tax=Octopus bimaculoides TaxID=37653 RepID=A0A0L8GSR4_OCTBM
MILLLNTFCLDIQPTYHQMTTISFRVLQDNIHQKKKKGIVVESLDQHCTSRDTSLKSPQLVSYHQCLQGVFQNTLRIPKLQFVTFKEKSKWLQRHTASPNSRLSVLSTKADKTNFL